MRLDLIAAMAWPSRVIGRGGRLPWSLPEDLRRFKALTLGHPVIMGRKTWESLPFKLPGRSNLVLSAAGAARPSPRGEAPDGIFPDLPAALAAAAAAPGGERAFAIGGERLYAEALPLAGELFLTLLHHPFEGDAYFPPLDLGAWAVRSRERRRQAGPPDFDYEFLDLELQRR